MILKGATVIATAIVTAALCRDTQTIYATRPFAPENDVKLSIPAGMQVDPDALASIDAIPDETRARAAAIPTDSAEAFRAQLHPWQEHPELLNAKGIGKPRSPTSVPSILRALPVGGFHVFAQYRRPSQISAAIAHARDAGGTFTSSRELSLVDGECIGVRVTRLT